MTHYAVKDPSLNVFCVEAHNALHAAMNAARIAIESLGTKYREEEGDFFEVRAEGDTELHGFSAEEVLEAAGVPYIVQQPDPDIPY